MLPDNKGVPPEDKAYQSIVSFEFGVAVNTTEPGPHLDWEITVGERGIVLTTNVAVLFIEIADEQDADFMDVIVIFVDPVLFNAIVLKVPIPAFTITIDAVAAVIEFELDKL